jgi:hypothetical protein
MADCYVTSGFSAYALASGNDDDDNDDDSNDNNSAGERQGYDV